MQRNNYVIVGGSSGIGLALARLMSEAGESVWVYSRTNTHLTGLPNVTHVPVDIVTADFPVDSLPDVIHGVA